MSDVDGSEVTAAAFLRTREPHAGITWMPRELTWREKPGRARGLAEALSTWCGSPTHGPASCRPSVCPRDSSPEAPPSAVEDPHPGLRMGAGRVRRHAEPSLARRSHRPHDHGGLPSLMLPWGQDGLGMRQGLGVSTGLRNEWCGL